MPRSWLGSCSSLEPHPICPRSLAGSVQPGGGLECCAWGEGHVESDQHCTAAEAELAAIKQEDSDQGLRKWSLAAICPHS